ncbi:MAG: MAPEG family protein [Deltaproteobacteria bacterium]|nr:MAPEG family protein [Deltaproteobacteria bacterium]
MTLVAIIAAVALAEYGVFMVQCGQARGRFGVAAPATVGDPVFERYFRVQQNTIEQLVIFLPSLFLFAWFVSTRWAVVFGILFIVGRALYARGYVADPAKRGPGFLCTVIANAALLLGGVVGALIALR